MSMNYHRFKITFDQLLAREKLSNEEISKNIHAKIIDDQSRKIIAHNNAPYWIKKLDWNKLLKTKLFNNPKI